MVKIFANESIEELEMAINAWEQANRDKLIVDTKFSMAPRRKAVLVRYIDSPCDRCKDEDSEWCRKCRYYSLFPAGE